jgi:hypothetical protein
MGRRCIKLAIEEPLPRGYRVATISDAKYLPEVSHCINNHDGIAALADGWIGRRGRHGWVLLCDSAT